jgi:anaerobic selenocysteine-containing dehydrogenase
MAQLGRALTELDSPRIEALIVYNSNPAAIAPDQTRVIAGLRREDLFTVVLEQFQTDTADFADFVLPVTTFLEHTDLYLAYGHYYLQLARPALLRPGETKPNVDIFRALAKRLGFDDCCFDDSEDDMIRQLLDTDSEFLRGITLERLERERSIRLNVCATPFANGGFATPSGRFEFGAEDLAYSAPIESRNGDPGLHAKYPLEFVSSKNDDSMNSSLGHRDAVDRQTSVLSIHPSDAAARGITSGALVRVFNERGTCYFDAKICEDTRPGVVSARSTRWNKCFPCGWGANRLTSDRLTDMGGGPTFYSCLVEVEKTQP